MTAGSTKLIWSRSQRMRSASPTERNYPNAEIIKERDHQAVTVADGVSKCACTCQMIQRVGVAVRYSAM